MALAVPITVLTATGVAFSPAAQAAGLVANGGFETSTSGWTATPTAAGRSALLRAPGGHTGSYAAQVVNVTRGPATTVLNDGPNSVAATKAGQTYRATAWMKADRPGASLVLRLLEYAGSARGATASTSVWATDTAWHQLTVDLEATRSGATVDLNALVWGLAPGASFRVDDVGIAPVSATTAPPAAAPTPRPPAAPAPGGVLPAQGTGALFGYYQAGGVDPRPMEKTIGRTFDLVHRYADFDGAHPFPNTADQLEASQGRTVHLSWELQDYDGTYESSVQPAPAGRSTDLAGHSRRMWTYAQVLNGSLDRYLDAEAGRFKAAPGKYLIDIDHEMDDRPDVGGADQLRAATGTRAQYVAAYRHVVDRFRAQGVSNVTWGWTVSGWYAGDASKAWSLQQLWPGSSYVNIIMWDPYNSHASSWRSFGQLVAPFYNAVHGGLLDKVDVNAKRLPMGLSEYGSVADPRRPAWLRAVPTELRSYPAIVSISYFNSGSWAALNDSASVAAFADAGRSSYLHTRH